VPNHDNIVALLSAAPGCFRRNIVASDELARLFLWCPFSQVVWAVISCPQEISRLYTSRLAPAAMLLQSGALPLISSFLSRPAGHAVAAFMLLQTAVPQKSIPLLYKLLQAEAAFAASPVDDG
jgi:hypothetical protein